MMVVRVEGIVNGDPVVFRKVLDNQWEAEVPASLNGVYILEMTAWDDAGNMAYTARYLLLYDPTDLRAALIPLPYAAELEPCQWRAQAVLSDYVAELEGVASRGR